MHVAIQNKGSCTIYLRDTVVAAREILAIYKAIPLQKYEQYPFHHKFNLQPLRFPYHALQREQLSHM
jgi:hypothetical protein